MPLSFGSVIEEHHATRTSVGLFDISHMGRTTVTGSGAADLMARVCTASVEKLPPGRMQYTLACDEHGGILDDLMVYRLDGSSFMICANASNAGKILGWLELQAQAITDVKITDQNPTTAQVAVQGPRSREMMRAIGGSRLEDMRLGDCMEADVTGIRMLISRSGYTGEPGFELYLPGNRSEELWKTLVNQGEAFGAISCGLGCRDTLRLEMGYPLYGNDIDVTTSPLEASLDFAVDFSKEAFIGRESLAMQKEKGLVRKLAGFELTDPGVPRHGQKILVDRKEVGFVTSGNHSPSLKKGIGMGYLSAEWARIGQAVTIDIRGKHVAARIVTRPFYRKKRER
jgi:aminomethyltransferase